MCLVFVDYFFLTILFFFVQQNCWFCFNKNVGLVSTKLLERWICGSEEANMENDKETKKNVADSCVLSENQQERNDDGLEKNSCAR